MNPCHSPFKITPGFPLVQNSNFSPLVTVGEKYAVSWLSKTGQRVTFTGCYLNSTMKVITTLYILWNRLKAL
uniref:Uncharacterized protein n=1 Tax=Anguilla anguilla TaxID=7936 RepID=A0A0E9WI95_ANGAN